MRLRLMLGLAAGLALAACGGEKTEAPATDGSAATTQAESPAEQTAEAEPESANPIADVCGKIDHAATLTALGFEGGKIEKAEVQGGGACSATSAAGDKSVVITLAVPIEMGAPATEASAAMDRMLEAMADPANLKAHPPAEHTVKLTLVPGMPVDAPITFRGWLNGSPDGEAAIIVGDLPLHVAAKGVDKAKVLAFINSQAANLMKPM